MMSRLRRILCACVILGPLPAVAAEQIVFSPTAPYAQMRTLQTLQEQIAHGNAAAQAAQPKLMIHIAEVFMAADPEAWSDPRNSRAAVLFLFSGGKPEIIRTILEKAKITPAMDRVVKGALAYGEGEEEIAQKLLDPIDPRTLPNPLGGHLALIKATLLMASDPAKADKLLDVARLLMPGTLVEEAALRRQIFMLADGNNLDKVTLLSRQYLHRFRTSVYAENFRERFAAATMRMAAAGDITQLGKMDAVVKEMRPDEARRFYLAMAKSAIINGKVVAARFASEKAKALSVSGSADEARATLYSAAALVASDRVDDGMTRLSGLDASRLPADDASLREAALSVGTIVGAKNKNDGAGTAAGPTAETPSSQLIAQAQSALENSDRLLKDVGK